jgi:hypothetical protein
MLANPIIEKWAEVIFGTGFLAIALALLGSWLWEKYNRRH